MKLIKLINIFKKKQAHQQLDINDFAETMYGCQLSELDSDDKKARCANEWLRYIRSN